ncbi:hypothetical protein M8C21_015476, partial [Ambrosia artemisiifolia]
ASNAYNWDSLNSKILATQKIFKKLQTNKLYSTPTSVSLCPLFSHWPNPTFLFLPKVLPSLCSNHPKRLHFCSSLESSSFIKANHNHPKVDTFLKHSQITTHSLINLCVHSCFTCHHNQLLYWNLKTCIKYQRCSFKIWYYQALLLCFATGFKKKALSCGSNRHAISFKPSVVDSTKEVIMMGDYYRMNNNKNNNNNVSSMVFSGNSGMVNSGSVYAQIGNSSTSNVSDSVAGLKHDAGLAVEWSVEEQCKLEEGIC